MTNQVKNEPELRFPGFEGEWKENFISEVVDFYSGLTYSPDDITNEKGTFVIRSSNIKNNRLINADNVYVNLKNLKVENVDKGDIIVVVRNGSRKLIGKHALVSTYLNNTVIGAFMTGIRSDYNFFINALLDTENFKRNIHMNLGATINQITTGMFKKMKFYFPKNQEQQKIGDFFSKLDQQIELEEQKLEKLEEQKKGYMQKLFSQELRFKTKDDVYYSEWQLHKLGEIFKYSQGQQISVDKQFTVKNNEMKRFIRIVDITENPEPRFVLYESDTGLVNKGDLFMIRYGRPGIVSIGFEGIIANNLFKLIPKIKISTIYFYYLLSYNYYRINLLTNQSTMPALNFKSLDLLKFKIPSYKEQNKIGNFFTKFDELIEKQNKKIDGLKERKKSFLQKMFV